ncbi:MAG: sugar phosphate isomerase/epimerase family protein [Desulfobacterales bacterium]|jgi:sugar phosphate isomerase/epimerase|nr:sugar phosphate isomerase/epimerase family protein [Desulfobacterales bacterium]
MNFAFSSNAFKKHSLSETIRFISNAGYSGIEIMCDRPHLWPEDVSLDELKSIRALLYENGLAVSNISAFMMCAIQDFLHPSWIEPDKSYRALRVAHTLKCIDIAAALGARTISTEPGGPLDGMDRAIATEIFMEGLSRAVSYAEEKGIRVLIEPEPNLLIETSDQFLAFANAFGKDRIGLNLDIGHAYCVGENPVEKVLALKEFIGHFHIEDIPASREHRHMMFGEGGIDIKQVLKAIEQIDYRGFVTVELYTYQDCAPQIARKSRQYLKDVCGYE